MLHTTFCIQFPSTVVLHTVLIATVSVLVCSPNALTAFQGHLNRLQSIRSPCDYCDSTRLRPTTKHLRIRAIAEKERTLEKQASKKTESLRKAGPVQRLTSAQQQLQQGGVSTKELLWRSLLAGLTFGTLFQVTHNNGFLPVGAPSSYQRSPGMDSLQAENLQECSNVLYV